MHRCNDCVSANYFGMTLCGACGFAKEAMRKNERKESWRCKNCVAMSKQRSEQQAPCLCEIFSWGQDYYGSQVPMPMVKPCERLPKTGIAMNSLKSLQQTGSKRSPEPVLPLELGRVTSRISAGSDRSVMEDLRDKVHVSIDEKGLVSLSLDIKDEQEG